jgi:hypothetical protein
MGLPTLQSAGIAEVAEGIQPSGPDILVSIEIKADIEQRMGVELFLPPVAEVIQHGKLGMAAAVQLFQIMPAGEERPRIAPGVNSDTEIVLKRIEAELCYIGESFGIPNCVEKPRVGYELSIIFIKCSHAVSKICSLKMACYQSRGKEQRIIRSNCRMTRGKLPDSER